MNKIAFCAPLGALLACSGTPAFAHGVIGQRFFPATISSDDPFAADEMALPTITSFDHETDIDFDYSKSILPGFAIGVGIGHVDAKSPGEPRARGFGNLDISTSLELYRNTKDEFIFTTGLDWHRQQRGRRANVDVHADGQIRQGVRRPAGQPEISAAARCYWCGGIRHPDGS